jgi:mannosyltransferase
MERTVGLRAGGEMTKSPRLALAGSLLVVAGLSLSNASIEHAFGRAPHSLAWGPALFRVLLVLHGMALIFASFLRSHTGPSASSSLPISRTGKVLLGFLLVVALLLRLPSLNSCLWLDEVLTMVNYARPPLARIFTSFPDQNQHLLYSLLAHCSMRVFSEQAYSLRLPAVFFGVGSVWALFLLGRRLMGENEALLASLLMTVSYHHIWFSQNARGYTGLLLFTNLATWLWLEAMERDRWRTWLAYAVCVALGLAIHMTMLFVAAAHALIFLVVWLRSGREKDRLGRAAAAYALGGTLALQVYALSLPEFFRTAASEVSPPSEWTHPLWVVTETLRNLRVGFAGVAVVLCGGLLAGAGWVGLLRRSPRAAWAMVLPGLLGGASMLVLGHNLWPRFFFFCMGFGLLILVRGAMQLPATLLRLLHLPDRWSRKVGYALAGIMIVASLTTVPRCYALPKQDFTGARDYVKRQQLPGDVVMVVGLAAHAYSYYAPAWPEVRTAAELTALVQNRQRAFLIYTLPIELRAAHPDLWKAVEDDFETVRVFPGTLGGGDVYVCCERSTPSGK